MPILPLDHIEPFAATLGVMLYPATDEIDPLKARAFAAQWLAESPYPPVDQKGYRLPYDVLRRLITDGGQLLDLEERLQGGLMAGDLFKALYALASNHPDLASWENAIRVYELYAARANVSGSRSALWQAKRRFLKVAHLWAAWSIHNGKFQTMPEEGYDGFADFRSFLTEAEILRDFGQNWRHLRAKSEPPLPAEVWRVPEDWSPLAHQPGWPKTGGIPDLALSEDALAVLKTPGGPSRPDLKLIDD
jgi:hypothetical protein